MEPVTAFAAGRIGIGVALLVAPRTTLRLVLGDAAAGGSLAWLGRALGVRDALLGVGALTASREGRPVRQWLTFAAAADGVDALAALASWGSLPARRRFLLLLAGASGAAAGLALAQAADEPA